MDLVLSYVHDQFIFKTFKSLTNNSYCRQSDSCSDPRFIYEPVSKGTHSHFVICNLPYQYPEAKRMPRLVQNEAIYCLFSLACLLQPSALLLLLYLSIDVFHYFWKQTWLRILLNTVICCFLLHWIMFRNFLGVITNIGLHYFTASVHRLDVLPVLQRRWCFMDNDGICIDYWQFKIQQLW